MSFRKTPLKEVMDFLRAVTQKNIVISPTVKIQKIKVTLKAEKLSIQDILALVLFPHNLTYRWEKGKIVIENYPSPWPKAMDFPKQKISVSFNDVPLTDAVALLLRGSGKNFIISSKVKEQDIRITLRLNKVSLKDAFDFITKSNGLTYEYKKGIIVIRQK